MRAGIANPNHEPTPSLTIQWCQQEVFEEDWIRFLFSGWHLVEKRTPSLDRVEENSLLVLSSNVHPLDRLDPGFLRKISSLNGVGLFHLSDEWFCGGYEVYRHFSFVLRNYQAQIFKHPGIRVVPLGWTKGTAQKAEVNPSSQRRWIWTFAGNSNWTRNKMIEQIVHVVPHQVRLGQPGICSRLSREEYLNWLRESAFCPCPMGNVVLETFRLYEALEAGCIPIVEHRLGFDYFRSLLGDHPLPSVRNWKEGASLMKSLASDRCSLDHFQSEIRRWWSCYKARLQEEVKDFVLRGLAGQWRQSLSKEWYFRSGPAYELSRRLELLRHHSPRAALERIFRELRERGPTILWRGGPKFKEKNDP
ncbi:exostosin family protein [Candidatus Methylacidiphilum infernorum]|uniref:Exostosin family protein n=1 Tax=Candidatus Methylacidiphilum infernorum TaxID=511746 RepID=A0ABX7PUS2_9BACT|nr:exostosin family protein [Candidatus Methylacidiphilum infernorum]QSR86423.1 exostosin family protein [Candidatus Methylacidiphilum infernorum]